MAKKRVITVMMGALIAALVMSASAFAASGDGYFVQADIVRAAEGNPRGPGCVPNSVFFPEEGVVFRAKVFEVSSGKEVTPEDVKAEGIHLTANLSDGQTFPLHLISHPPTPDAKKKDLYWTAFWPIPKDYPAGPVSWSMAVKDGDGKTGMYDPIGQSIGIPTLLVMPQEAFSQGPAQGAKGEGK